MSIFPNAAAATSTLASPAASGTSAAGVPNYEAVRRAQELAARMGFRQDPQFAPLINMFPGQMVPDVTIPQKPTKAPVLRLDAQGREIDEHGNVVNVTKPSNLSTLKVNINKQKKDAFEILKPVLDVDPDSNPHFDPRMGVNKTKLLRPKRNNFLFVEEGKWSKDAETIKLKSQFGEAQAKEQKAKQAQLAKAKAAPDINPNLIEITERVVIKEKLKDPIPEIEWWDLPLLQSGNYGDIADGSIDEDKLKMEKITFYVEHPRPIEPPAEPAPPPPQPLKLTKQEQKKLRTQRRIAKEKDRQEMIRQGVIEPPKPKVKISNLMKVLGAEATQDPTRLEKEIRSAAAEREQAHIDRNIARKLTPAELREKKERKLFDDPNTVETLVSLYRINDLSHPKARFRVDVNAQENRLTGCAVISDGMSIVVVEGGSKSIKRYGKLMLRRINWSDVSKENEENDESDDDKPVNKCVLVWQGSVAKPSFNRFSVHDCITEAAARKVFVDAGVPHYWDQAVNYVDDGAV
ncbi:protein RDM16 isoform X2 [Lotus japonicus]|nr:protein RDM16 isoform X2 [Lotus japonicus]